MSCPIPNDLKTARTLLSVAGCASDVETSLFRAVVLTARAPLISQGIEAASSDAIFAAFCRHCIAAGLIDAGFLPLLAAAAAGEPLRPHQAEAKALLEAVEALHHTLEAAQAKAPAPVDLPPADVERDYHTVVCPMNFVKVMFDLEDMEPGQRLKVLLADGDPIRNVPRSLEAEGHKVLQKVRTGDAWTVLIEKV